MCNGCVIDLQANHTAAFRQIVSVYVLLEQKLAGKQHKRCQQRCEALLSSCEVCRSDHRWFQNGRSRHCAEFACAFVLDNEALGQSALPDNFGRLPIIQPQARVRLIPVVVVVAFRDTAPGRSVSFSTTTHDWPVMNVTRPVHLVGVRPRLQKLPRIVKASQHQLRAAAVHCHIGNGAVVPTEKAPILEVTTALLYRC